MLNSFDLPFTDEERLVQQTTREWVEAQVLPSVADHFEAAMSNANGEFARAAFAVGK